FGDIGRSDQGLAARLADEVCGLFELRLGTRYETTSVALASQTLRDVASDSAASSCNQCNFRHSGGILAIRRERGNPDFAAKPEFQQAPAGRGGATAKPGTPPATRCFPAAHLYPAERTSLNVYAADIPNIYDIRRSHLGARVQGCYRRKR